MAEPQPINVIPLPQAGVPDAEPKPGFRPEKPFSLRDRKSREEPTTEELLANINRSLPFSDEAEKGVLSGLLHDPRERLSDARVQIPLEAFYHEANRLIYETLQTFYDRGTPLDIATLTHALREKQVIDKVGGAGAISQLYSFIPVSAHYDFYKKVLMDKHVLRQLIHACSLNIHYAYEHGRGHIDEDVDGEIDKAEQRVLAVREGAKSADGIKPLKDHVMDAIDSIEQMLAAPGQLRGISSGYKQLDDLSAGLQGGEMFVIAARPSMGKTALALNIAEQMATGGNSGGSPTTPVPIALFSLEMSKSAVTQRLISARSGIPSQNLRGGIRLSDRDYRKLLSACDELAKAPVYVDDTPNMTVLALRARARRLVAQHGVKAIMIDYL